MVDFSSKSNWDLRRVYVGDAGIDIVYKGPTISIGPNQSHKFNTGIFVEFMEPGTVCILKPRSSSPLHVNGVIDNGYRGEIICELHNLKNFSVAVLDNTAYAQILHLQLAGKEISFNNKKLEATKIRGTKGFGSSGLTEKGKNEKVNEKVNNEKGKNKRGNNRCLPYTTPLSWTYTPDVSMYVPNTLANTPTYGPNSPSFTPGPNPPSFSPVTPVTSYIPNAPTYGPNTTYYVDPPIQPLSKSFEQTQPTTLIETSEPTSTEPTLTKPTSTKPIY
jgi:dUTPase